MMSSRESGLGLSHLTMTIDLQGSGEQYVAYLEQLSEEEDARKSSLEQRGIAVITTSGALATLLFGLVAVFTKAENFSLPSAASAALAVALVAFTVAAIAALLTNIPMAYVAPMIGDPEKDFWPHWEKGAGDAMQRVAGTRLKVVKSAQDTNGRKARRLFVALCAEVMAVIAVAVAVAIILVTA